MSADVLTLESEGIEKVTRQNRGGELIDARTYRIAQICVRTLGESSAAEPPVMNLPDKVAAFFMDVIARRQEHDPEVEGFYVLLLDRKNRLKSWTQCTAGTATAALAHPREVFRAAVMASACAVVCVHNHPSGDPAPSSQDLQITRRLKSAGEVLEIAVLDHVVIGRAGADPLGRGFYSFREAGLL